MPVDGGPGRVHVPRRVALKASTGVGAHGSSTHDYGLAGFPSRREGSMGDMNIGEGQQGAGEGNE